MRRLELTAVQRAELEAATAAERRVGRWKRYRAILLLAEQSPAAVAAALGCGRSSVYGWAAAWRQRGAEGLRERPRGGRPRRLGGEGEAALEMLLGEDPQARGQHATGWTVPLLRAELARGGHAVSEHTVRRALHRRGWRWKRPKYVLGRPDPDYAEKRGPSPSGRPRS
jgi:transposase